jgi:hypothetical protein
VNNITEFQDKRLELLKRAVYRRWVQRVEGHITMLGSLHAAPFSRPRDGVPLHIVQRGHNASRASLPRTITAVICIGSAKRYI